MFKVFQVHASQILLFGLHLCVPIFELQGIFWVLFCRLWILVGFLSLWLLIFLLYLGRGGVVRRWLLRSGVGCRVLGLIL
jgi:hypothetical protein